MSQPGIVEETLWARWGRRAVAVPTYLCLGALSNLELWRGGRDANAVAARLKSFRGYAEQGRSQAEVSRHERS